MGHQRYFKQPTNNDLLNTKLFLYIKASITSEFKMRTIMNCLQVKKVLCEWLAWILMMERPGYDFEEIICSSIQVSSTDLRRGSTRDSKRSQQKSLLMDEEAEMTPRNEGFKAYRQDSKVSRVRALL